MNGWTPTTPEGERIENEIKACKTFLERDPRNQYYLNRLADLEQRRILFNITPEAHEEYMGNLVHAAYMEAAEPVDEAARQAAEIGRDNEWLADVSNAFNAFGLPHVIIHGGEVLEVEPYKKASPVTDEDEIPF